ncbi:lytic transglycosylase domain-containing protein, partial [Streptomyces sp. NPDC059766]|uniref:aggregation-promoting factor C-terminal-like domain-containing protein n=1 Tax=Streptomyces sp. NPDC059766 TaxID=3346940 RepID=UPI00365B2B42
MSLAAIRRIASPKKALTLTAVATATAGLALAAAPAQAASTSASSAQAIAHRMIPDAAQYNAFNQIVTHESGWNHTATNSSSGAYGLVQALP